MEQSGTAFTEERARAVLAAAARPAAASAAASAADPAVSGAPDAAGARLLALGENAVFAVGDGLVVKVARSAELLERAEREVRIAGWLAEHDVPAVRAASPRARLVDGHPVTYWVRLPEPVRPAGPADLAGLLRLVHALPEPSGPSAPVLPPRDLLGGVERWLRLAGEAIDPADAAYLRDRRDGFAATASALTPRLPRGPVHGDALPRNVQVGPDGPVLVDLETFSSDLREHDLVVMALSRDRYGLDPAAYDTFTAAYGWDVREWDGCAVLRGARETASCAWVAQHAPANPAALAEFRRRVASLRDGDPTVRWYPF
ncbi:aminoglycoside phosphotransferase family protein [Streptomyces sp. RKAG293]|uniref:phosphotransferase enzyme family protein n=1 Tax=Streptomyces sp. RKAG293 TaxID=2893403 RepID=UPI0020349618|nr:aminoglycoside phosphotransferase family protein [Streptomyces sp. RKAG293]MCM2422253.1 aminoglycoside phosphotransferase family protein [Streptomyces sp. RKAG293]